MTVADDKDYDDEPLIEGLDSLISFANSESDQFSLRVSWVPFEGYEGDYLFSHHSKIQLYRHGIIELKNDSGESLKLQLWERVTFTDPSFIISVNNNEE